MVKNSLDRATWAYILGWIPISLVVGYVINFLGWDETFPLLSLVVAMVIFLIFVVPLVAHLEKKSKKF
jgi:sugar phosphate permease